ncbi:MAG: response regulator [Clostridiales Family XIII bacterium]|jgi:signal transduction histidine kinase/ActR/RegA family two-component response regulator/HAMP domain-containing protein|nr:response regulator [Clostridiales Family XIII bacterium]
MKAAIGSLRKVADRVSSALDAWMDRLGFSMRTKLVMIFLIVKIVPLIALLLIAWSQFAGLGGDIQERTQALTKEMNLTLTNAGELAVNDSTEALNDSAIEQIERITTDTAHAVADFLYSRDDDIRYLASLSPTEENYRGVIESMTGLAANRGVWSLSEDGMSWVRTDAPEEAAAGDVSTNPENDDEVDGAGFRYRPPDANLTYSAVPLYDEITFIGTDLKEKVKVVSTGSSKTNHPLSYILKDISNPANTYTGAETYGAELRELKPGDIYVSDVVGAYVPSHFVGMYTPKQMAAAALKAEAAALGALEKQSGETEELAANLTAAVDQIAALETAPSGTGTDAGANESLMKEVADKTLSLVDAAAENISDAALLERAGALKTKIEGLRFDPENEAYAGEENPIGKRFEGIVRWATPVTDDAGEIIGYVSFALNHDHIMEFTDHITPMSERYVELPNAFAGNYAFIWDYQCRSICHPRHHSIVGYDAQTGAEQIPWLETSIYEDLLARVGGEGLSDLQANWADVVNDPQVPDTEYSGIDDLLPGVPVFDDQSRGKKPAPALTAAGLVGLDGRYLNNAPQCTGWMDLTKEGGSGSFYILWSGLYKLTTAAAIPYYTGQYAPSEENGFSRRGFAMVTIGAGLEDFQQPAHATAEKLDAAIAAANEEIEKSSADTQKTINDNLTKTTIQLVATTAIIVLLVIFIAVWMASFIANNIYVLIRGLTRFRMGERQFRFHTARTDEFGELADSFDDMADSITGSVSTPLSITDTDLKLIYMNDMALDATGNKLEDITGQSYKVNSIYPFATEYCPITALDENREAAVYYNKHNGRYYQGGALYLYGKDGEKIGYIITSTDLTEVSLNRIRLEQAVSDANRANEAKGAFLARMSHEIRTPMNAIIGVTNIVEKKLGDIAVYTPELTEIKSHVAQIENSSQHLLGLLNDILDLSKIEAGKIEISKEPIDLQKLVSTVEEIIRPRCAEKNITLETRFDPALDVSASYLSDSLRLRQVLINLLGNAVKFTPELGHINFFADKTGESGDMVRIKFTVNDTGIGISEESLSTIFEVFEQGDGGITRQYGGTGLGLPISRSIVQLLEGDIIVNSKPGEGSDFSFEIWVEKSTRPISNAALLSDDAIVNFADKCILIVDDVEINRMIASTLLEDTGIAVAEAGDGEEALQCFKESEPHGIDIILMDVMMPVMNGLEAASAIRALDREDAKTVPIIALTANAFKEDMDKTIAAGMDAHLSKPIDPDSLIEILYKYLAHENGS